MSGAGSQNQKPAFPIDENSESEAVKYALSVREEAKTLPPFVCSTQNIESAESGKPQTLYHKNARIADYDFEVVLAHTRELGFESIDAKNVQELWKSVNSTLKSSNDVGTIPQTKADWKEYMLSNKPIRVDRKTSLRLLDYLAHWLPQRAPGCLVDWAWFTLLGVQLPVSGSELSSVRKLAQMAKVAKECDTQTARELLMAIVDVVATVFRQSDLR